MTRRTVVNGSVIGLVAGAFALGVGGMHGTAAARGRAAVPPDSTLAAGLLGAARGAPGALCRLAERALENRWGGGDGWRTPGDPPDADGIARWAFARRPADYAVSVLARGIEDADGCVRGVAARLIARAPVEQVNGAVVPLLGAAAAGTRVAASVALGFAESDGAVTGLIGRLGDDVAQVRVAAAWALGRVGSLRAAPPLRAVLRDGEAEVRAAAARSLGDLEDTAAVDALARLLRSDASQDVRVAAAEALGRMEARRAVPALSAALGDQSTDVRRTAAWALGQIEDKSA